MNFKCNALLYSAEKNKSYTLLTMQQLFFLFANIFYDTLFCRTTKFRWCMHRWKIFSQEIFYKMTFLVIQKHLEFLKRNCSWLSTKVGMVGMELLYSIQFTPVTILFLFDSVAKITRTPQDIRPTNCETAKRNEQVKIIKNRFQTKNKKFYLTHT